MEKTSAQEAYWRYKEGMSLGPIVGLSDDAARILVQRYGKRDKKKEKRV